MNKHIGKVAASTLCIIALGILASRVQWPSLDKSHTAQDDSVGESVIKKYFSEFPIQKIRKLVFSDSRVYEEMTWDEMVNSFPGATVREGKYEKSIYLKESGTKKISTTCRFRDRTGEGNFKLSIFRQSVPGLTKKSFEYYDSGSLFVFMGLVDSDRVVLLLNFSEAGTVTSCLAVDIDNPTYGYSQQYDSEEQLIKEEQLELPQSFGPKPPEELKNRSKAEDGSGRGSSIRRSFVNRHNFPGRSPGLNYVTLIRSASFFMDSAPMISLLACAV